jgi:hypothetical protein
MVWVDDIAGSGMMSSAQCRRLGEDDVVVGSGTASQVWDGACMIDGVTGSSRGRWWCVKGLNRGRERRRGGSVEDLTMA